MNSLVWLVNGASRGFDLEIARAALDLILWQTN